MIGLGSLLFLPLVALSDASSRLLAFSVSSLSSSSSLLSIEPVGASSMVLLLLPTSISPSPPSCSSSSSSFSIVASLSVSVFAVSSIGLAMQESLSSLLSSPPPPSSVAGPSLFSLSSSRFLEKEDPGGSRFLTTASWCHEEAVRAQKRFLCGTRIVPKASVVVGTAEKTTIIGIPMSRSTAQTKESKEQKRKPQIHEPHA